MKRLRDTMDSERHSQRGFTLIELIVVITIISILAAVALPRLIDAQRDARVAKVYAIAGALRSAKDLARSRCDLDLAAVAPSATATNCTSTPPVVFMDGYMVRMINHYPTAAADGIDVAAQMDLVADGLTATNSTSMNSQNIVVPTRTYDISGGTAPFCRVTYREAALTGSVVVGAEIPQPVVSGC